MMSYFAAVFTMPSETWVDMLYASSATLAVITTDSAVMISLARRVAMCFKANLSTFARLLPGFEVGDFVHVKDMVKAGSQAVIVCDSDQRAAAGSGRFHHGGKIHPFSRHAGLRRGAPEDP